MAQQRSSWQPLAALNLPDPGVSASRPNKLIVFLLGTVITGAALLAVAIGGGVTALQKFSPPME